MAHLRHDTRTSSEFQSSTKIFTRLIDNTETEAHYTRQLRQEQRINKIKWTDIKKGILPYLMACFVHLSATG
jgi:hypothetical protein